MFFLIRPTSPHRRDGPSDPARLGRSRGHGLRAARGLGLRSGLAEVHGGQLGAVPATGSHLRGRPAALEPETFEAFGG